jgi:hypothetical protein
MLRTRRSDRRGSVVGSSRSGTVSGERQSAPRFRIRPTHCFLLASRRAPASPAQHGRRPGALLRARIAGAHAGLGPPGSDVKSTGAHAASAPSRRCGISGALERESEIDRCSPLHNYWKRSPRALVSIGTRPSPDVSDSSGLSALARCGAPLHLVPSFDSQGTARRREDALVAVIPFDPVSRRGVPTHYFLNHAAARLAVR